MLLPVWLPGGVVVLVILLFFSLHQRCWKSFCCSDFVLLADNAALGINDEKSIRWYGITVFILFAEPCWLVWWCISYYSDDMDQRKRQKREKVSILPESWPAAWAALCTKSLSHTHSALLSPSAINYCWEVAWLWRENFQRKLEKAGELSNTPVTSNNNMT